MRISIIVLAFVMVGCTVAAPQCAVSNNAKVDCLAFAAVTQQACEARNCCWAASSDDSVPICYHAANSGYTLQNWTSTVTGYEGTLTLGSVPGPFGNDIKTLKVVVDFDTQYRLHFKIVDASKARWEVPFVQQTGRPSSKPGLTDYDVTVTTAPFGLAVTRRSTGHVLLNTTLGGLVFNDQYLSIAALLGNGQPLVMYGIGEHVKNNNKLDTNYITYTQWARDQGTPIGPQYNLYASHPFYTRIEPDGSAHGVFLLNSNAMDIKLQPQSVTFRTIGGVLDFFVFLGPQPDAVVSQYTEVIGRTYMPPYWSLGFHLCRWGYGSLNATRAVVDGMRANRLPQDVQWNDIDHMRSYLDFTLDPVQFPAPLMKDFVDQLHSNGQHYVMIVDPGISNVQPAGQYPPFDEGVKADVFIKANGGGYIVGKVWPGATVFPDFFHPKAVDWWTAQVDSFQQLMPFDGMWIDMNEISNFFDKPDCKNEPNPPYVPGGQQSTGLYDKTICTSAIQTIGIQYDTHNMFGYSEMRASMAALNQIRGKRSLVISRSTFPNSGQHGGHWLGDNDSNWVDLRTSITGVLDMNLFGIPLVGADVCGFGGNSNAELCTRWMQAGAFYPFYRNHNTIGAASQEPYVYGEPFTTYIRNAMMIRYALIPHLYTLFHNAHVNGGTVARSMVFEFSKAAMSSEPHIVDVDQQFMWGRWLLISPVMVQGASSIQAYFPQEAIWYNLFNGARGATGLVVLPVDLNTVPVHIRGGGIIPTQKPGMTTTESRRNAFGLVVALSANGDAEGALFMDDGEALSSFEKGEYTQYLFQAQSQGSGSMGSLQGVVSHRGYQVDERLGNVTIFGVSSFGARGVVTVNGQSLPAGASVTFSSTTNVLQITGLTLPLNSTFSIAWDGKRVGDVAISIVDEDLFSLW